MDDDEDSIPPYFYNYDIKQKTETADFRLPNNLRDFNSQDKILHNAHDNVSLGEAERDDQYIRQHSRQNQLSSNAYHELHELEDRVKHTLNEISKTRQEQDRLIREIRETNERKTYLTDELRQKRKTFSRRCAEYLSQYEWYFPQKNKGKGVNLETAWSYYERFTLPRHLCDATAMKSSNLERASPGEAERATKLYPAFTTPREELGDFGIGIGLYFTTLNVVACITLFAGIFNLPLLIYYASDEYGGSEKPESYFLRGSAICTNAPWVICIDCDDGEAGVDSFYSNDQKTARYATEVGDGNTIFVRKNMCPLPDLWIMICSFGSVLVVLFGLMAMDRYMSIAEVRFDENEQTVTDYSVQIENPPVKALDPNVWRRYFQRETGHRVTVVTIIIDNRDLVKALLQRRLKFRELNKFVSTYGKNSQNFDTVNERAALKAEAERIVRMGELEDERYGGNDGFFSFLKRKSSSQTGRSVLGSIKDMGDNIKVLCEKKYAATSVFVTFEKEEGQRACLKKFDYGKIKIRQQAHGEKSILPSFQAKILSVVEPVEPDAIVYEELSEPTRKKYSRMVFTMTLTLAIIVICSLIVDAMQKQSSVAAAITISLFNTLIPSICKLIHKLESHASDGVSQNSLYLKITIFRWTNTAIIISIITPFTLTLSEGDGSLLPTVLAIFLAEIFTSPLLRMLDLGGQFQKHYLAPRATTQAEMNLFFKGTPYTLAERYTELTKILFLAYYYAVYLPIGFFLCSLALVVYYYSDKFCLLRVWAKAPMIGTQLAILSRRYFFTTACVAFTILSAYAYVHFPTDNLCVIDESSSSSDTIQQYEYAQSFVPGNYTANPGNALDTTITITIEQPADGAPFVYRFCNQYALFGQQFPTITSIDNFEWLTSDQRFIANAFGWTSMIVLVSVALGIFGMRVIDSCYALFRGTYEECGVSQQIDYSNVEEMSAYVPMVRHDSFEYPLLTCDISKIDPDLVGWEPGDKPFSYYNLIHDVPREFQSNYLYDANAMDEDDFLNMNRNSAVLQGRRTRFANMSFAWSGGSLSTRFFKSVRFEVPKKIQKYDLGSKWKSVREGLGLYSGNRADLIALANAARGVEENDEQQKQNKNTDGDSEEEDKPNVIFSIVKHYPPKWALSLDNVPLDNIAEPQPNY